MDRVQQFYQEHPDFRGHIRGAPEPKPFYSAEKIKEIPITDVLENVYGISVLDKGGRKWCALRSERTASCLIYPNNTWCDFGAANNGGDVIKLVQELSDYDWYTAVKFLADTYHIAPENTAQKTDNSLSDTDWYKLGISPDLATKNMDIDIDRFGIKAVMSYTQKCSMTMNTLRSTDPKTYHRILFDRGLRPLEVEVNDYFSSLLCHYELCKSIGGEDFARTNIDEDAGKTAENLNKKFQILRRAVDDKSAVKVPKIYLSPPNDLTDILSGKTQFQSDGIPYFELCSNAKTARENVFFVRVPHTEVGQKYAELSAIPHTNFYRNGMDNICVLGRDLAKIRTIFDDKIMSVAERSRGETRGRTVNTPAKNAQRKAPEPTW